MFDLNEPQDFFKIITEAYEEYVRHPTERNFLFLTLGLTHLREWISESNRQQIQHKEKVGIELTDGEIFFNDLFALPEFRVIQELCNRGKHHITSGQTAETAKVESARAGLARAGDSLGQTYFLIDGHDSRYYFETLIKKYDEWFASQQD